MVSSGLRKPRATRSYWKKHPLREEWERALREEYAASATAMTIVRLRSGCGRDPDRLAWMHSSG